jgi:hypothetical protein
MKCHSSLIVGQEEACSGETEGSAGAWLWMQLGSVLVALMSLLVNERGHLGYRTASGPAWLGTHL